MVMPENKYVEIDEMIKLLRIQNHDMLNNFQVISGYIQLGNLEQLSLYLKSTMDNWDSQRQLFRWKYSSTILLILKFRLSLYDGGIKLIIKNTTDLKDLAVSEPDLNLFLSNILKLFHENKTQEDVLTLRVSEEESTYLFEFGPCFHNQDKIFCENALASTFENAKEIGSQCGFSDNHLACRLPKKSLQPLAE